MLLGSLDNDIYDPRYRAFLCRIELFVKKVVDAGMGFRLNKNTMTNRRTFLPFEAQRQQR